MRSLAAVLAFGLFLQAGNDSRPSSAQLHAVLDAINKAVDTEYYDSHAADAWLQNERQHEDRILEAATKQQAVDEIRAALADLHNSHVFFYTREEWDRRENLLPLTFEKRKERVFVRTPLGDSGLKFGDEITQIDGQPASALEPKTLTKLTGVYGNPLYGDKSSIATLTVASHGGTRAVQVRRIQWDDQDPVEKIDQLNSRTFFIRLLNLPADEAGAARLQTAWKQATSGSALIIDLRDCTGGWPAADSYLLDSLVGDSPGLFKVLDRQGAEVPWAKSFAPAPRFTGRVAVLMGEGTQSGCEWLAAALKQTERAVLVGSKTAGAFNGFTQSVPLPDNFARFALPYTRTVWRGNVSYEGIGVAPDKFVESSIEDFQAGRDRVLEEAKRLFPGRNRR